MSGTGGFVHPEKIIQSVGILRQGMRIADFGCGAGYFTIPLAKAVGGESKVFAFDILEGPLSAVKHKVGMAGLTNVELARTNLEERLSTKLPSCSVDVVWLANILFQSDKKKEILAEAKRILHPGGFLVVIEWSDSSKLGPWAYKIPKSSLQDILNELGLFFVKEFDAGSYHYGLLFRNA